MSGRCIIVDIDGTLADLTHRRVHVESRPKNWKKFFEAMEFDPVHPRMVRTVWDFFRSGYGIVLCSGREEVHRDVTVDWLGKHDIPWHSLYMRPLKDYRPDDVVKEELLDQILAHNWEPLMVFDDRQRVVDMWRRKGLIVHQVAEGDF